VPDPIDVDMPFSRTEVASMTSEAYASAMGRSDMPNLGYWESETKVPATPRVLVVDDEPVVVNSIRKTLARKSYRVEEAFSGREALERVTAESFDLVLLDMRLPDANGLDLLADMKKQKPELRIVIVTGYASIDTAVEAIKRGANDYMPKPFTPDELSSIASKVLGRVA
jgi:NtrC-family two-component system response regulator AlgB